jgi:DNA-binding transcriptional LysR family regulator
MQRHGRMDLPAVLGRFHRDHPGVEIRLRQAGSALLIEDVVNGWLDLALVSLSDDLHPGLESTVLASEAMLLACAATHRLAASKQVGLADLRDETFVDFHADCGARTATDRAFAVAGVERHVAFELNDVPTLLDLVAYGLGVALVPSPYARRDDKRLRFLSLSEPAPVWRFGVVVRADGPTGPAARTLLDMIVSNSAGA